MEEKQLVETFFLLIKGETAPEDIAKELFFKKTGKIPHLYQLCGKEISDLESRLRDKETLGKNEVINIVETYRKFAEKAIILEYSSSMAFLIVENAVIIFGRLNLSIICENKKIAEEICQEIVWDDTIKPRYSYLVETKRGFRERSLDLKSVEVDLERNYNDDLPFEKITNFLKSDEPGIVILNGEPGTGKSSLIKHMINIVPGKRFVIIQPETLAKTSQDSFIDYFTWSSENTVFILEDCEKLLMKREKGATDLHTILNLSDGLLGDSLKVKFLCTFNTSIGNIDEALLRRGRLKVRYEMGKLSLEKTRLHIPDAKEGMTLAEIYNREENTYGKDTTRKKVGF